MPTLQLRKAPTYTLSLQLYTRIGGAAVGGAIALTEVSAGVYEATVPNGDYDGQLLGFTDPPGPRFPIRDGIGYECFTWPIIDATIVVPPVVPSPITAGLCNVLCAVTHNGQPAVGAIVSATLEDKRNSVDSRIASRSVELGISNEQGYCVLRLIQFEQFTYGGVYRFIGTAADGRVFLNRRAIIPSTPTANLEALANEPE